MCARSQYSEPEVPRTTAGLRQATRDYLWISFRWHRAGYDCRTRMANHGRLTPSETSHVPRSWLGSRALQIRHGWARGHGTTASTGARPGRCPLMLGLQRRVIDDRARSHGTAANSCASCSTALLRENLWCLAGDILQLTLLSRTFWTALLSFTSKRRKLTMSATSRRPTLKLIRWWPPSFQKIVGSATSGTSSRYVLIHVFTPSMVNVVVAGVEVSSDDHYESNSER